ncbi:MAG TPA: beta-phosphoglucomutase family hydrolase [Nocardioidaceae bacterium]|nr:beta-phosphoglucomutase family hydrolase [Nocardioidaceae bacterium]
MGGHDAVALRRLGLPSSIEACLFDLDGVLTQTAAVHKAAWKATFDPLLADAGQSPFTDQDYLRYVDGRRRADGVRAFLASRGLDFPEGEPGDPPERQTVHGIGNQKNDRLLRELDEHGVEVYRGSERFLRSVREAGLSVAVVTASANAAAVLQAAGLTDLVETRVDGVVAARDGLRGKPAPDTFLAAAEALGVEPERAAVFEDALSGVQAGRSGGFGFVVGVDRAGQAEELRRRGAHVVVTDLADLLGER